MTKQYAKNQETKPQPQAKKSNLLFLCFCSLCVVFLFLFTSLGIWQIQRLSWKEELIARVEARLSLPPIPAPNRTAWPQVNAQAHEYLPVTIRGRLLHDAEVLITTVTDDGPGYWLLTPLQTSDGAVTFINRGFVPMDHRDVGQRLAGQINTETTITGLLRLGEGAGFFPRRNDPAQERWYSRELPAMAQARGFDEVAPYFIDADKTANPGGIPIGGLTVVNFRNSHLAYAITWFILAFGVGCALVFLILQRRKQPEPF